MTASTSELHDALAASQRLGLLGARPIAEVIEHARRYVRALQAVTGTVVDLGAGGGVPGLVIAHDRRDLQLVLIDRRQKRTDVLERLCRRYDWLGSVEVLCADVDDVIGGRVRMRSAHGTTAPIDAVVARSFGPPASTLRRARALVRPGGRIVISDPPDGDRWDPVLLHDLGLVRRSAVGDALAVFDRA